MLLYVIFSHLAIKKLVARAIIFKKTFIEAIISHRITTAKQLPSLICIIVSSVFHLCVFFSSHDKYYFPLVEKI